MPRSPVPPLPPLSRQLLFPNLGSIPAVAGNRSWKLDDLPAYAAGAHTVHNCDVPAADWLQVPTSQALLLSHLDSVHAHRHA